MRKALNLLVGRLSNGVDLVLAQVTLEDKNISRDICCN